MQKRFLLFLKYNTGFLLCCVPSYFALLISGKSLMPYYQRDIRDQYLPGIIYARQYLIDYFNQIVSGHGFIPKQFDFIIGYGSDVLQTLGYYILNPLYLLSPIFPVEKIEYFYDFIFILTGFFAGLFFLFYIKYICPETKTTILIIGSLAYSFSGFGLFACQPVFRINYMLFPVLILGIEKLIRENKIVLFTLSVCACFLFSFFYVHILGVFAVAYFVLRVFIRSNIKQKIKKTFKFISCGFIGIGLASIVLLPNIAAVFNAERGVKNSLDTIIWSLKTYYFLFKSWFFGAHNLSISYRQSGIILIVIFACIILWRQKGFFQTKTAFIGLFVFLSTPIFTYVLDVGMYYDRPKWFFVYPFILCVVFIKVLPKILEEFSKYIKFLLIVLSVGFVITSALSFISNTEIQKLSLDFGAGLLISILTILGCLLTSDFYKKKQKTFWQISLCSTVFLCFALSCVFSIFIPKYQNDNIYSNQVYKSGSFTKEFIDQPIALTNKIKEDNSMDNFYRYTVLKNDCKNFILPTNDLLTNEKKASTYYSLTDKSLINFKKTLMKNKTGLPEFVWADNQDKKIIDTLTATKKTIRCDVDSNGSQKTTFETNKQALGFSYSYSIYNIISEKTLKKQPFDKREEILFRQGSVDAKLNYDKINEDLDEIKQDDIEKISTELKKDTLKNIVINNNEITGSISLKEKKFLVTQIPYIHAFGEDSAWKAFDNGKEIPVYQGNLGWVSLVLDKGEHSIVFKYQTTGLKPGGLISGLFLLIFIAVIILNKLSNNKRRRKHVTTKNAHKHTQSETIKFSKQ